ncbi:pentatricopeptide repeat-containing protein At2g13420, mitochondrial-like [Bidens hawaiensis]|uniref:pentatricopeptide repeat-containing protein At2g13420, mitochondrial-like n=1 Tax=Bidens hawaiensis TaxID=980011 RepID=UPI0040494C93
MALRLTLSRITSIFSQIRPLCSSSSSSLSHSSISEPETVPKPSLEPSPDADLISQILIQHHNPYHTMESTLQLTGITLTQTLVTQTLIRLQNTPKIALPFFIYTKNQSNYTHSTYTYNLMIDILAKVRQFDAAWKLIIEMDQNGVNPNSDTFYVLIRRLVSAGLTRQAIRAFEDMGCFVVNDGVDQDQQPIDNYYFLFDTLCKYGYPKVATEVFNKWKNWRFEPDAKVYTMLINGWCQVNKMNMAERFFNEMVSNGIEPNVVTYNVVLNGMCRRSSLHPDSRFERTVKGAHKVFDEMLQRGIDPDVTSYSILLHVYSRAHKTDGTLEVLKMMKEKGVQPSLASYTSVVKCLCSCGRMEHAYQVLDEMLLNGVTPSAMTYNCFFKEYRGRKDVDGALRLYNRIKDESGLIPDTHMYNILLGMFIMVNRLDLVKEIWDDMKGGGSGPDLDSYTMLVHHLCDKEKWQQACEYFVEMIEKGILPQKVTFETLYRGLIQADMLRTWRRLKKKLDDEFASFSSEYEKYHFKPFKR